MGEYPIYLPDNHPFTAKLTFNAHLSTLHGGVGLTMGKVREKYWVPRLRRLVEVERKLSRVHKIPGQSLSSPTARKSTHNQNRGFKAVPSNRSRFHRTDPLRI